MKRILLVASLLSLVAQIPVQAAPQFLSKIISPATQQMVKETYYGYEYDAKQLAAKGAEVAHTILEGTETAFTMPFTMAGRAMDRAVNGIAFVCTKYPAISTFALLGGSVASFRKAKSIEKTPFNREEVDLYITLGTFLGIGGLVQAVVAYNMYVNK